MATFRGGSFELRYESSGIVDDAISFVNNQFQTISTDFDLESVYGVRVAYDAIQDYTAAENWQALKASTIDIFGAATQNKPITYIAQAYTSGSVISGWDDTATGSFTANPSTLHVAYALDTTEKYFYVVFTNLSLVSILSAARIFRASVGDRTDITNISHVISNMTSATSRMFGYGRRKYDYEDTGTSQKIKYKVIPPYSWDSTASRYRYFSDTTISKTLLRKILISYFGTSKDINNSTFSWLTFEGETALDSLTWADHVYSEDSLNASGSHHEVILRILDFENILADNSKADITLVYDDVADTTGAGAGLVWTCEITSALISPLAASATTRDDVEDATLAMVDFINTGTSWSSDGVPTEIDTASGEIIPIIAKAWGPRTVVLSVLHGTANEYNVAIRHGDFAGNVNHAVYDAYDVSSSERIESILDDNAVTAAGTGVGTLQGGGMSFGVAAPDDPMPPGGYTGNHIATTVVATNGLTRLSVSEGIAYTYDLANTVWNQVEDTFLLVGATNDSPTYNIEFMQICTIFERAAIPHYLLKDTLVDTIYRSYEKDEDYL